MSAKEDNNCYLIVDRICCKAENPREGWVKLRSIGLDVEVMRKFMSRTLERGLTEDEKIKINKAGAK